MECCSSIREDPPLASEDWMPIHALTLPKGYIILRRILWILKPQASDESAVPLGNEYGPWIGAIKTLFWIAVTIGLGLLLARLSG